MMEKARVKGVVAYGVKGQSPLLGSRSQVVYVLTTPMLELLKDATVEAIRIRANWENDDYICRGYILNGSLDNTHNMAIIDKLPPSWKDFKHTLKHSKDELSLVQLGSYLRIEESLRSQDSDKGKGKEVSGPSVNMTEEGKNKNNKQNKGKKHDFKNTVVVRVPTRNLSWNVRSVARLVTSKGIAIVVDAIAWWIDSGAITHVCKDHCWFKTYEPMEDGSVIYMGDDDFAPVHGKGRHVHYKIMLEMSKDDLIPTIDENLKMYYLVIVRLPDPKRKTLGEKGIDCIFVGYAEHSKAYRPKDIIPNSVESQRDDHSDDVPSETPEPRKDVIIGIKIKHENKGIVITQSHYIEKILKKFNREDYLPVSTLMDPVEKLKPNTGKLVDQLEYSRAISCLMYPMTSTRPDIAYVVGRFSRFINNPSRQHWKAITIVFKYLRGTINYGLSFVGYLLVLEAYSDASWINHVEDSSSMSGWVFLLRGGSIS
uniref:Zinc finger, CCHC-type n=1 Tax=Tanacetum cinerariifolium TaxID=118510 RepID=A0A6L2P0V7_TANCI|nr:zinc finger, CCHC-type [Tanacetum cinerariifolium]